MALQGNSGTGGAFPAGLQPTQTKALYQGNYIDFTATGADGHDQWRQQFLPDVYEKEINKYGKRTIAGFLKMISAEMPSTSDQIIWTEQGRLHARYVGALASGTGINATPRTTGLTTAITFTIDFTAQPGGQGQLSEQSSAMAYRAGQTVMIQEEAAGSGNAGNRGLASAPLMKGIITTTTATTFVVTLYNPTGAIGITNAKEYTTLVYGSEFAKGTDGMSQTIHPTYETYQNSPIIMKDHFAINGSDTSQIGWIEVSSENGASGYLWYIKSEHENRLRWEDYQELAMLEAIVRESDSTAVAAGNIGHSTTDLAGTGNPGDPSNRLARGTEGFFQALEKRGNLYEGLSADLDTLSGIGGLGQTFDQILKQLDKQGAIEENMLYVNRDLALAFDNFLATQNNYGGSDGVSWGVFNNSKDTALDLGFSGFRRGSYDFYKTDWKYLNDWSTRGGFGDIEGALIPAGSSTVYDEVAGGNVKRPFLHVRYRSSEADNRKMKSWITGSVGGAYTNDTDELRMHYLTERCLITQAPNNFFLFKGNEA